MIYPHFINVNLKSPKALNLRGNEIHKILHLAPIFSKGRLTDYSNNQFDVRVTELIRSVATDRKQGKRA